MSLVERIGWVNSVLPSWRKGKIDEEECANLIFKGDYL